jgi:hypothetical protein
VTLYAFDPKAAAQGQNGWLLSAIAGTWPNLTSSANIVPVVANGLIYVASYKQLSIFGLAPASATVNSPAPPASNAAGHEIFGIITRIVGGNVTVASRTGKPIPVDAADAVSSHLSVVLLVGEPVAVFGDYDGSGVLHATSVLHATPSSLGWPADR